MGRGWRTWESVARGAESLTASGTVAATAPVGGSTQAAGAMGAAQPSHVGPQIMQQAASGIPVCDGSG